MPPLRAGDFACAHGRIDWSVPRELRQHRIADGVPVLAVDVFEVIAVWKQKCDAERQKLRVCKYLGRLLVKAAPIGQPGQRICMRQLGHIQFRLAHRLDVSQKSVYASDDALYIDAGNAKSLPIPIHSLDACGDLKLRARATRRAIAGRLCLQKDSSPISSRTGTMIRHGPSAAIIVVRKTLDTRIPKIASPTLTMPDRAAKR